jgi:prepilin-type processing-associated H-X9-DG protein
MHNYHSTFSAFPPGLIPSPSTNQNTHNDLQNGVATAFNLMLDYFEQDNLKKLYDPTKAWYDQLPVPPHTVAAPSIQVKLFYCPSNRSSGVADLTPVRPFVPQRDRLPNPAASDYLLCKGANAGLCKTGQVPGTARGAFEVGIATTIGGIIDGTSNTIAIGDGTGGSPRYLIRRFYTDTTPWIYPGTRSTLMADNSWAAGSVMTRALALGVGYLTGSALGVTAIRHGHGDGRPLDEPMNNPLVLAAIDFNTPITNCNNSVAQGFDTISGFRSLHAGGCNFVFCDGSVRFLKQNLSADVYRSLSTIAGGEVVANDF